MLDKNSDQFFELWFGAAKARDVLVPVNWRLAPPEIAYIVNDAEAEMLFVGEEYVETIERLLPELRTVKQVVALAGSHPDWEEYTAWRDRQASADPRLETTGDDIANPALHQRHDRPSERRPDHPRRPDGVPGSP